MSKTAQEHHRSWVTTVFAGIVCISTLYFAYAVFALDLYRIGLSVLLTLTALYAGYVSCTGDSKALRDTVTSFWW